MTNIYTQPNAAELKASCHNGLITNHPVPPDHMQKQWPRMKRDRTLKTAIRDSNIYNVVCDHTDCRDQQKWADRVQFGSFKKAHWIPQHGDLLRVQIPNKSHSLCRGGGARIHHIEIPNDSCST